MIKRSNICLGPKLINQIFNQHFNETEVLGFGWGEWKPPEQHETIIKTCLLVIKIKKSSPKASRWVVIGLDQKIIHM